MGDFMKLRSGLALAVASLLTLTIGVPANASARKPKPPKPWVALEQSVTASFLAMQRELWLAEPNVGLQGSFEQTAFGCIYLQTPEGDAFPTVFSADTKWSSKALRIHPFDDLSFDLSTEPIHLGQAIAANEWVVGAVDDIQALPFKITQQCLPKGASKVLFVWGYESGGLAAEVLQ